MKMADRCIFSLVILCIAVICDKGEAAESENALTARKLKNTFIFKL